MKKIDPPFAVQDVVRRRLKLASSKMLEAAFGTSKLSVSVFYDDNLKVVSAGPNKFSDKLVNVNREFGSPVPWVARTYFKTGDEIIHIGRNGSHSSIGEMTLEGAGALVTAAPGTLLRFHNMRVRAPAYTIDIDLLVVGFRDAFLDWTDVAQEFWKAAANENAPSSLNGPQTFCCPQRL